MWRIVSQFNDGLPVDVKTLRYFPSEDPQTGKVVFKRMSPIVQVIVAFGDSDKMTKIKWNARSNSWVIQSPDKLVHPTIKVNGEVYKDHLAEPVSKPGDKQTFASSKVFFDKITAKFGEDFANEVYMLMHEEIMSGEQV